MEKLSVFIVHYRGHHGDEARPLHISPVTTLTLDMMCVFQHSSSGFVKRFSSSDHGIALYHLEIFKRYDAQVYKSTESPFMCFFRWDPVQRKLKLVWRPAACRAAGIEFPSALLADAVSLEG